MNIDKSHTRSALFPNLELVRSRFGASVMEIMNQIVIIQQLMTIMSVCWSESGKLLAVLVFVVLETFYETKIDKVEV